MAELTIRPEEIRAALDSFVESYTPSGAAREEVGRVTLAGDGIAQVEGLPGAMASELLEFEDGTLGLALNLDVREIGVVVLGEFTGIEEGQVVRRTGEVLSVAVGDGYLGRVVDTIINQKANWETGDPKQQVRCIYVAIGQKGSTIMAVRGALEEAGALEYTMIVASPA